MFDPATIAATIRVSEPFSVVCPVCHAAVTAKCNERKRRGIGGFHFVDYFHQERIDLAARSSG